MQRKRSQNTSQKYDPFPNCYCANRPHMSYMVHGGIPYTMFFCFMLASVIPTKFLTGFYCRSNTTRKPCIFLCNISKIGGFEIVVCNQAKLLHSSYKCPSSFPPLISSPAPLTMGQAFLQVNFSLTSVTSLCSQSS